MADVRHSVLSHFRMVDGLNTVSSLLYLKPGEYRDIQNMTYNPIGGLSKRNGYAALNTSPVVAGAGVTGLHMSRYTTSGGTNLALMVAGSKLYTMAAALGGTWTDATSGLTITDDDTTPWSFAQLNDITVLGNGSDNSIQVNSSGTASALSGGGLPFTNFLIPVEARGYMFYGVPKVSGTIQYDRWYFSDINDPATVGANNFIDTAKGQGGVLRGGAEYKGFFFSWKENGIYQFNYQPTRVNSSGTTFPWTEFPIPIVPGVGTKSPRSILKFTTPSTHVTPGQELVFFVDQFMVPRIFDGKQTISFASKIGSSVDTGIKSLADMDHDEADTVVAVNYPDKNYILIFMSQNSNQNDVCWVLDYNVGFAMGRHKLNDPISSAALFQKSDGTYKPFLGNYDGTVFEWDSGTTDNGFEISDYAIYPEDYVKDPFMRSKWFDCQIRGKNGSSSQNTKVSFYADGGDTSFKSATISLSRVQPQWGAVKWNQFKWGKKGIINKTLEINNVSKTNRIKVESDNKLSDTLVVEGVSSTAKLLGTSQD